MNAGQHGLSLGQYLVIPKPKHAKTRGGQPRVASAVMFAVQMLPPVGLDNESRAKAHEVDDIRPQGLLAPELMTTEAPRAQVFPQQLLGLGQVAAQLPGELALVHGRSEERRVGKACR